MKRLACYIALLFSLLFYSCKEQNADMFNGIFFTGTTAKTPTLTTTAATNITLYTATSGGNITSDGGIIITARGVCWSSTSETPTTALTTKTNNGTGTGTFTSSITGLTANTKYCVRAYATNSGGTAYGNAIFFTTTLSSGIPTLTTTAVGNITSIAATSGGNITSDGGAYVTARGVCWSTSPNPTIASSPKTSDGSGTGAFTSTLTGLLANSTYYIQAYAINSAGTAYGNELILKTYTGTVFDGDVNVYNTVTIGTQVWMVENLKSTKYRDGSTIPNVTTRTTWIALTTGAYCWYNNATTNKNTYGALYNYYAVVDSRNLCPTGWHVPTAVEWTTLTTYLGGVNVAGGMLKEVGFTHWTSPNTGANNSSGFTALPGGYCGNFDSTFLHIGTYGDWWTVTQFDADSAWDRGIDYRYTEVYSYHCSKRDGYSVRCLQGEGQGLAIGQSYLGGIIAYILQSGDPGYSSTTQHGLIAAPTDQSTSIVWWNGSSTITGATATALGTGNANTNTIVASQGVGTYAAKLCYDLVLGGYSDWYLPSKDELNKLYLNRVAIGGFTTYSYWSSSENSNNNVWCQYFTNGAQPIYYKYDVYYVRAVRAF